MSKRAFDRMHGGDEAESLALLDPWAPRPIERVAREFSRLPLTTRLLVAYLK